MAGVGDAVFKLPAHGRGVVAAIGHGEDERAGGGEKIQDGGDGRLRVGDVLQHFRAKDDVVRVRRFHLQDVAFENLRVRHEAGRQIDKHVLHVAPREAASGKTPPQHPQQVARAGARIQDALYREIHALFAADGDQFMVKIDALVGQVFAHGRAVVPAIVVLLRRPQPVEVALQFRDFRPAVKNGCPLPRTGHPHDGESGALQRINDQLFHMGRDLWPTAPTDSSRYTPLHPA